MRRGLPSLNRTLRECLGMVGILHWAWVLDEYLIDWRRLVACGCASRAGASLLLRSRRLQVRVSTPCDRGDTDAVQAGDRILSEDGSAPVLAAITNM